LRSKKNGDRFAEAAHLAAPEKRKAHAGVCRHRCMRFIFVRGSARSQQLRGSLLAVFA
jgi:hypothetical protein